jgi:hypothetical protein
MVGIVFAKRESVAGFVVDLGGEPWLLWKFVGTSFRWRSRFEDKEKHNARARWICPWQWLRMIKEAAINHGRICEARACRVFNHGVFTIHQASRRDSTRRVV